MKKLLLFICLFISITSFGQREYGLCDSSFYTFNTDTTIIAGRKKLYIQTGAGITLLRDFTMADTNFYIRDFDIIKPTLWYTLVGARYIGAETYLYRSVDRGQTWALDTSYYAATLNYPAANNYYNKSINQLQRMGQDSIALFMHYYESGIFFSVDGGDTWREWFRNMQTHYQGILECDYHYYLYSFEGDAIKAFMFPFHKSKLFANIGGDEWYMLGDSTHARCIGTVNDRCIYAANSLPRCHVYNFFVDTLVGACATLPAFTSTVKPNTNELAIYPNPAHDGETITISTNGDMMNARVLDYTGRQINVIISKASAVKYTLSLKGYAAGIYTIVLTTVEGIIAKRITVE